MVSLVPQQWEQWKGPPDGWHDPQEDWPQEAQTPNSSMVGMSDGMITGCESFRCQHSSQLRSGHPARIPTKLSHCERDESL